MTLACSGAEISRAAEAWVVVLQSGLEDGEPVFHMAGRQVEPRRALHRRGRILDFFPLLGGLIVALKVVNENPGEARIAGYFPTLAGMVFELLAHGEARRLVGAVHIADAGEIASANNRVDLPPGMRERFRMEDGIREVVFGISTVADVAIRGRDHESGPIALGVEGRANAFRALAIHRGHQQIWQTREAVGINKGPAELPFHPRVGDGGIPEHSRHLRYRSHVGNVMIP